MMYRLRVTTIKDDDEHGDGGNVITSDRYFGSLPEVLSTQPDREIAIQLILAEVGKGYTINEAVRRLISQTTAN